jgi:two-component system cell cycle response regulator CpdR
MKQILVVDDDESMTEYVKRAMEKEGYTVQAVNTAQSAYQLLQNDPDGFELLITDVVMPGVGGVELAAAATAIDPALRVLFISGYSSDYLPKNCFYLEKPFRGSELKSKVLSIVAAALNC